MKSFNLFEKLYEQILIESILDTQQVGQDTPFAQNLLNMYEFEYKLNALKNRPFNGMPERLENMIKAVTNELINSTSYVKNILLGTLYNWLRSHAITNPKTWAMARVKDSKQSSEEFGTDIISLVLWEYNKYYPTKQGSLTAEGREKQFNQYFHNIINIIERKLNSYPAFKNYLEKVILPYYKNGEIVYLEDDPKNARERYNVKTNKEALNRINNLTVNDLELDILPQFASYSDFQRLVPIKYLEKIAAEMYENFVFPLWYGHWKEKGIDKTRANIERIYKGLKTSSPADLGNMISWTNAALNAVHQNGSMLDHVEDQTGESDIQYLYSDESRNLQDFLDELTRGHNQNAWDKSLQEVGIELEKFKKLKGKQVY